MALRNLDSLIVADLGPYWKRLSRESVNNRLRFRGPATVALDHRPGKTVTGAPVVERFSSSEAYFYWRKEGRWINIEEYFLVTYGWVLRYPEDPVCRFDGIYNDQSDDDYSNKRDFLLFLVA